MNQDLSGVRVSWAEGTVSTKASVAGQTGQEKECYEISQVQNRAVRPCR